MQRLAEFWGLDFKKSVPILGFKSLIYIKHVYAIYHQIII